MKRVWISLWFFLVTSIMLIPLHEAASQDSAGELYEAGIFKKEADGDLEGAIQSFLKVITEYPEDKKMGAKAQLQIGLCYEKLRVKDASEAYQKVIDNYPGQEREIAIARARLAALTQPASDAQGNGPTYRLALDSKITGMSMDSQDSSDFSPSGDRIVFTSERKLYMADGTGTVIRPLFDDSAAGKIFGRPRWSPDGQQIAYLGRHEGAWAIFVLSPDGGTPQKILSPKQRRVGGLRWTYDSKHLTYRAWDGFHVIALDGSEVRFIPGEYLPGKYHIRSSDAEYSPNGRWLAYCGEGEYEERGIWILADNLIKEIEPRKGEEEKTIEQEKKVKIAGIPDPNLAAAIRDALGKPDGAITAADLESITELKAPDNNIRDITGIERCVNLERLILGAIWGETKLEISNRIEDISPLKELTKLVHLNLTYNKRIGDISPLSHLTNLTELRLYGNQISDVRPLTKLINLTVLSLGSNPTGDLAPLANLTNLTWLSLSSNRISDVTPLTNLTNLTVLLLDNNQIDDLTPLANFTNLTQLQLWSNQISDVAPLANLTNLTELWLSHNQIGDVTPLANLTKLTYLDLDHNQISDITPLANLTNLTELRLQDNQVSDLTPLSKLTNLTALWLWDNQIGDITPLANLTNLTELRLQDNQISDLTPLSKLTNLTALWLWDNQISDVTPLFNLTDLTMLGVHVNQVVDVTPLANLANLTYLDLDHNQISDITPLANLTNLTRLQVGGNQVVDITPLSGLTNLTLLILSINQISDITPLSNLTNLIELHLNNNQISDVTPLSNLANLEALILYKNQISDVAPLANLTNLTELQLQNNLIEIGIPATDPTWAPDGHTLYFVNDGNIWRLPIDPETGLQKGDPQQVTFFEDARVRSPKVLRDGDQIAFQLQRTNTSVNVANGSPPYEPRILARGRQCIPQVSPDGQTIYYVGDGIFAVPREGGTPRQLTKTRPLPNHRYLPYFHLSTDGGTLAYLAKLDEGRGIFTLPVSGGLEPQLVVNIGSGKANPVPQWSPDGSQLAYADGNGLYVIPAAGGQPRELAHLPDDTYGWDAWTVRWSPDGKFIAALGYPKQGFSTAVLVIPAAGGEMRQLTPDSHDYLEGVEWHPDGQRLSYNVDRRESETRQAYMDGRPPTTLVDHPDPESWDYIGAWAPDGRRFFYMSSGKKGYGVYVYDEATGDITLFADVAAVQSVPRWSRDGKTAAWYTTRITEPQAWVMQNFLP